MAIDMWITNQLFTRKQLWCFERLDNVLTHIPLKQKQHDDGPLFEPNMGVFSFAKWTLLNIIYWIGGWFKGHLHSTTFLHSSYCFNNNHVTKNILCLPKHKFQLIALTTCRWNDLWGSWKEFQEAPPQVEHFPNKKRCSTTF